MKNRDCEICYWDKEPKCVIIVRKNYLINQDFYKAIKKTLITLFETTDNEIIIAEYHGLNKAIIYYRENVLKGKFDTKELRKMSMINNE